MNFSLNPDHCRVECLEKLMVGVQCAYNFAIAGEIAEFGTATGLTATLLAHAIAMSDRLYGHHVQLELGRPKDLYLFDSFQGFPDVSKQEVDKDAIHVKSQIWGVGNCRGLSRDQLFQQCAAILPPERIRMYEGWYADTMKTVPDGTTFALLHLDCDLYSSTMDVLGPLLSRKMLSEGALIFFDDWDTNRASRRFGQRRAWKECVEKYNMEYSDHGEYGFGGHKFILHDYRP
jgi:O-methyltransferase